mmetsp:Transcript_7699/g.28859  ORF Transcript_7699/g.28859 Transcript_7699/m.28859 type:complete len:103 (-) Transcript_7699:7428-7736(-)
MELFARTTDPASPLSNVCVKRDGLDQTVRFQLVRGFLHTTHRLFVVDMAYVNQQTIVYAHKAISLVTGTNSGTTNHVQFVREITRLPSQVAAQFIAPRRGHA